MAEDKKKPTEEPEVKTEELEVVAEPDAVVETETETDATPNETKWRNGFAERHPDIDTNDTEAYFGTLNDELEGLNADREELGKYREDNERMAQLLEENPAFAAMFTELAKGDKANKGNFWQSIARIAGPDFVKLMEDPDNEELAKTVAEGLNSYAERVKRSEELEKEAAENIDATFAAFNDVCEQHALDDEQKQQLYDLWDNIMQGALVNRVDEATWDMLAKAVTHDNDVADAAEEGEIRGRNTKISQKLRSTPNNATIGLEQGRGNTVAETRRPNVEGVMAEQYKPWYERG